MPRFKQDKVFEYKIWWIERIATSPFYYAARYDQSLGRVCRKSLGTRDLEDAKDALIQLAQVAGPKTEDSYLSAVLAAYFREVSDEKPSAAAARYAGRHILSCWGETARVSDVSDDSQRRFWGWSKKQGHSPAYTSRIASVLSAGLRHGMKGTAPRVVTCGRTIASYQGVQEPQPREWIPTDDDLARFLDGLLTEPSEHVFRYVLLALNTAARPEAILNLHPTQIDFERGLLDLNPAGRPQNKKFRPVVRLTETLAPWLQAWGTNGPYVQYRGLAVSSVKNTFKRRRVEINLPMLTPYSLRHKMATELAARRVPGEVLSRQLGHKLPQMRTTDRYIKFDPRHLAESKAAIEEYIFDLNRLTDADLLQPDTFKILSSGGRLATARSSADREFHIPNLGIGMVGERGFEPPAPTSRT